jgi:hypothetical protein
MAVRPYSTITTLESFQVVRWDLLDGDVGTPIHTPAYEGKTVHVYADAAMQTPGTFGTGGVVTVQGSNDWRVRGDMMNGTQTADWVTLTDPRGNPLVLSAGSRFASIGDAPRFIRPIVSAGTGVRLTVAIGGLKRVGSP